MDDNIINNNLKQSKMKAKKEKIDLFGIDANESTKIVIDFVDDEPKTKQTKRDKYRFTAAIRMLPEMARQAYEEGLDMDDAVNDAIEYADLLLKGLNL